MCDRNWFNLFHDLHLSRKKHHLKENPVANSRSFRPTKVSETFKDLVDLIGSTEEAIRAIWIDVDLRSCCDVTLGITSMEKGKSRKDNQKYQAKSSPKNL